MSDPHFQARRGQLRTLRRVAIGALQAYALSPVSVSLLSHFCNTTFKVTDSDGSRYALHVYRFFDKAIPTDNRLDWIASEIWWLDQVRKLGLYVPVPVTTISGELVTEAGASELGAPAPCVLFRWLDGRFLNRGLRPEHLELVGRMTAQLHDSTHALYVSENFLRGEVDRMDGATQEWILRTFTDFHSKEAAAVAGLAVAHILSAQEKLGKSPETFGIIHADIHQRNYLFLGGRVGLIDFGDCGWGHYLYDLAVTISQIGTLPRAEFLKAALLAGYGEVRRLPDDFDTLLSAFVTLRELQDLATFIESRDDPAQAGWTADIDDRLAALRGRVRP